MKTDYDRGHVAEQYRKAKDQPWRLRVETYSFLKLIGDLRGKTVVDVACGEGHFTRRLGQGGAVRVVGVDVSQRMIELACDQEAKEPLGIEYRVEDAGAIAPQPEFDLVVAAWLLGYAKDRTELAQMCRGLASRVRPGGRFVTVATNPDVYSARPVPDYNKYGFELKLADRVYEGAPIRFTIHLDDSDLNIENYYLPVSAYESAFQEAGFREFQVHALELGPDPRAGNDGHYWAEFLRNPIAILIDCVKT